MFNLGADFDSIFYANPQPLLVFDQESLHFVNVNEAACQLYGYTREEFLQLRLKDIRSTEEVEKLNRVIEEQPGQQIKKRLFRHLKKDGTPIEVEILSYRITFGGKAARLAVPVDVTEHLSNKIKLENTLAKMAHTLESISDGHFVLSHRGIVISWNKSAEGLTGVFKADILNKSFWQVIPEAVKSGFYIRVQEAIINNEVMKFEEHFPRLDKWFYTSVYPSGDDVSIFFQDITELKNHQHELRLKNRRLEEMAYFNSHELRRPVANIMGLYNLLNESSGASPADKEKIIEKIQHSCEEIDRVIKQIDQTQYTGQGN